MEGGVWARMFHDLVRSFAISDRTRGVGRKQHAVIARPPLSIATHMLTTLTLLCHGALVPPSPSLSRRSVLLSAPAAAAFVLPLCPASASVEAKQALAAKALEREAAEDAIEAGRDKDPLTRRLQKSRDELESCKQLLADKEWDKVRAITGTLTPVLTFRGYTGESVKSRAESWNDAGEKELSKEIFKRRNTLVRALSALENGVFGNQTNDKKLKQSPEELQESLKGSIVALDAVIDKMGCQIKEDGSERRWRSGACEILPLERNLASSGRF